MVGYRFNTIGVSDGIRWAQPPARPGSGACLPASVVRAFVPRASAWPERAPQAAALPRPHPLAPPLTPPLCVCSMGTDGMSYSLQSRDLIADSIETVMSAQW